MADDADFEEHPAQRAHLERKEAKPAGWSVTVQLMRGDVANLARDPEEAWRLPLRLYAGLDRLVARVARSLELSPREMSILLMLWDGGRSTMSGLADQVELSRAAMTTLADQLEEAGLIGRLADPTDRRRVLVTVTKTADDRLRTAFLELGRELHVADPGWEPDAIGAAASALRTAAIRMSTQVETPPRKPRGTSRPSTDAGGSDSW